MIKKNHSLNNPRVPNKLRIKNVLIKRGRNVATLEREENYVEIEIATFVVHLVVEMIMYLMFPRRDMTEMLLKRYKSL